MTHKKRTRENISYGIIAVVFTIMIFCPAGFVLPKI